MASSKCRAMEALVQYDYLLLGVGDPGAVQPIRRGCDSILAQSRVTLGLQTKRRGVEHLELPLDIFLVGGSGLSTVWVPWTGQSGGKCTSPQDCDPRFGDCGSRGTGRTAKCHWVGGNRALRVLQLRGPAWCHQLFPTCYPARRRIRKESSSQLGDWRTRKHSGFARTLGRKETGQERR